MRFLLLTFIGILPNILFSQTFSIEISLKNAETRPGYLLSFYGDDNDLVDSAKFDSKGSIKFEFNSKKEIGLYRLYLDKETSIDFIFNKENVKLHSCYENTIDSMVVISSEENKAYYEYLKNDPLFQHKLELLIPLVNYFPKDDKFYTDVATKYTSVQLERDKFLMTLITKNPNSFSSKIFKLKRTPVVDASMSEKEKMDFMKQHFWDNVNFNDTLLFRSNSYTSKVLSFLVLFNNRKLTQPMQEEAFIQAVDILLPKAKTNQKAFEFIMNFLMSGFENFKLEKVLDHISKNYKLESSCENQDRKTSLQKRLDSYQKLAIGKTIPQLKINDINNNDFSLHDLKSEYTLVIFWASWCPHCTQMMPDIKKLYDLQKTKKWEVVAFSFDTIKTAWTNYVKKETYNWINISDLKSWDSKIADEFCIYATPTMFLLDRKKIILAKPLTIGELNKAFKEAGLK